MLCLRIINRLYSVIVTKSFIYHIIILSHKYKDIKQNIISIITILFKVSRDLKVQNFLMWFFHLIYYDFFLSIYFKFWYLFLIRWKIDTHYCDDSKESLEEDYYMDCWIGIFHLLIKYQMNNHISNNLIFI